MSEEPNNRRMPLGKDADGERRLPHLQHPSMEARHPRRMLGRARPAYHMPHTHVHVRMLRTKTAFPLRDFGFQVGRSLDVRNAQVPSDALYAREPEAAGTGARAHAAAGACEAGMRMRRGGA
eukprot:3133-Chlamydomonas_euryale.AAC.2